MSRNLRDDYKQIHGVWIGFVEDIIKFYMEGGLTAKDGKKIRVPEWVMWQDPMKSGIIIGHLNEKKEIKNDILTYGFDVRVLETYRRKERSDSLNHGSVNISIENADADCRLELAVDGKPVKRGATSGKIDLFGKKRDSKIRVTLVRSNLNKLAGSKRYKVLVEYKDDPRIVNGKQQPSFYYESKAIYYVDIKGTGTGASAAPATKPEQPSKSTGVWVLKDTSTSKRVDDMWKNQKQFKFDANVELTSVTFETVYTDNDPKMCYTERTKHTWNHPGQTLAVGTTVPVTMTITDDGSVNVDSSKRGLNAFTALKATITYKSSGIGYGVFVSQASKGSDPGGGGVSISPGSPKQTKSFTSQVPVREASPGDTFVIRMESMQGPIMTEVKFQYVFEKGAPQSSEKVEVTLTAEEPEPEPDPEQMDNDPPEPGKVVKIKPEGKKTEPDPKPKPKTVERWYTHAEGYYKFKLPDGWEVSAKHMFDDADDDYDTIWSPDQDMAIICDRGHTDGFSDAGLKTVVKSILENNPDSKVEYCKLGEVAAAKVAGFNKDDSIMDWQVIFHYKSRGYHISVVIPAKSPLAKMPDPPGWMLGSIILLK